jgi:hypothetical protein
MVDIDGVISLFGTGGEQPGPRPEGRLHSIEGIPHFLSATAAAHLLDLAGDFELVWASGWEERANDHLPYLLGLPRDLPFLRFERRPTAPRRALQGGAAGSVAAHWKLDAIERHGGERPLAWIDDALDAECRAWAERRAAPTLLVPTDPRVGLTGREAELLTAWAHELQAATPPGPVRP